MKSAVGKLVFLLVLTAVTMPGAVYAEALQSLPLRALSCCKYCTTGKACGDTCISRSYTCHVGPGCACNSVNETRPQRPPRRNAGATVLYWNELFRLPDNTQCGDMSFDASGEWKVVERIGDKKYIAIKRLIKNLRKIAAFKGGKSRKRMMKEVRKLRKKERVNRSACAAGPPPPSASPSPSPSASPSPIPSPDHIFFVTSESYSANLGGLAGADTKCQSHAEAANLPGVYKAVLSTTGIRIDERVPVVGPILTPAGKQVFTQGDMFTTYPGKLGVDEFGNDLTDVNAVAWTSAHYINERFSDLGFEGEYNCNDWSSTSSELYGMIGLPTSSSRWLYSTIKDCDEVEARLYCLSESLR